jgi:hypothetical protein
MKWVKLGSNENWFSIGKSNSGRSGENTLEYHLDKIDIDKYYILKSSNCFRFLTIEEVISEKYSGYTFFKKEIYSKEFIDKWLDFLKINNINTYFLNKPFPPQYILDMIKIKETI